MLRLLALVALTPVGRIRSSLGLTLEQARPRPPSILVLVFDTLSAKHLPLDGYPRATAPNLSRFATQATVFHRHYSAGNFTTPGTASLLTGTYPWAHRALHIQGTVAQPFQERNVFRLFEEGGYHTMAFSHNVTVASLFDQFRADVDSLIPTRDLALVDFDVSQRLFTNDLTPAIHAESLITRRGDNSSSLFLYPILRILMTAQSRDVNERYSNLFPRGVPSAPFMLFLLEDAIDWTMRQLETLPRPFLAYLHFLPPHDPYAARREFVGSFDDDWQPPTRPAHPLGDGVPEDVNIKLRREYDEYLAYADAEFGRLHDFMVNHGVLDETYVVVTSDHGELFERGIWGHITPVLFDPVVRIPLLISVPGQEQGREIHTPTSSVDVLPTLLHIAGLNKPEWCEGELLPSFSTTPIRPDRPVYSVEAKSNPRFGPLKTRTVSLVMDRYKLVEYRGYDLYDDVRELYDLSTDPDELDDIYRFRRGIAAELEGVLSQQMDRVGANG